MHFRQKLAFVVFGSVFVIAGQAFVGLITPNADAQMAPQQIASSESQQIGRYQLVSGSYGASASGAADTKPGVFKLDSATGATWIYTDAYRAPKGATPGKWVRAWVELPATLSIPVR